MPPDQGDRRPAGQRSSRVPADGIPGAWHDGPVTRKPDTRKGDRHDPKRTGVSLRLSPALLAAIAAKTGGKRHDLIVTAVEEYLDRAEADAGSTE